MHQCRLENKAQTGESRRMDHPARQDAPRQRILKAARELFDAKGFHATTTAELANKAAVSTGQITRLFATTADVLMRIFAKNTTPRYPEKHWVIDRDEMVTGTVRAPDESSARNT